MTEANETTTTPAKPKRRAILAAVPALALGAARSAAANPDAVLIRTVADMIAAGMADDATMAPLMGKPDCDWTPGDREAWEAVCASTSGYLETLDEIADARPVTLEGLAAQAMAAAWHLRFEDSEPEDRLAWALVRGVLRLAGQPAPAWAANTIGET